MVKTARSRDATRNCVFSAPVIRRMEDYDRARRAMAAKLHDARRSRIAALLRRTRQFSSELARNSAADKLAASVERRCTCGWAKGPHATLCGLYVDEDADPFAKKTPDAVEELERDLTLLEVAQK